MILLLLLNSCFPSTDPIPVSAPVPTDPVPTDPVPTESPSPFLVPSVVPRGGGAAIYLCEPYEANVKLYIDGNILLGTFAQDITSGCMRLYYPSFNSVGLRTLSTKNYTQEIKIVEFSKE